MMRLVYFILWRFALPLIFLFSLVPSPVMARKAAYPVIFLHGLAESAERWYIIQPSLQELGLQYGGKIWVNQSGGSFSHQQYLPENDYFFVNFSDNQGAVLQQVKETRAIIERIRKDSGSDKVILIGFSMGGLVGRVYLTEFVDSHHVAKLISIGSPHQGSNWSRFYKLIKPLKERCKEKKIYRIISNNTICPMIEEMESLGGGLNLDSRAILDMTPPEWKLRVEKKDRKRWEEEGVPQKKINCLMENQGKIIVNLAYYLNEVTEECKLTSQERNLIAHNPSIVPLNLMAYAGTATHPGDVKYISTVGEIPPPEGADDLFQTTSDAYIKQANSPGQATVSAVKLVVLLKNAIGLLSSNPTWSEGGDGAVSASSQDISQIPWFQQRILEGREIRKKPTRLLQYRVKGLENILSVEKIEAVHMSQILEFKSLFQELLTSS